MALRDVKLDDKYDLGQRRVFVSGFQALVRLCLMQKELDRRNGLNTAGFVSGYRGSPLGGLDQQLAHAGKFLKSENIVFQPGLNEDLAATAVWGSQQVGLHPDALYAGGPSEGCVYVELTTSGKAWGRGPTDSDVHGVMKRTTDSPAWRHIQMLASLISKDGNTPQITGWEDGREYPNAEQMKQLQEENSRLKQLVADLSLDKTMLQDVLRKKF